MFLKEFTHELILNSMKESGAVSFHPVKEIISHKIENEKQAVTGQIMQIPMLKIMPGQQTVQPMQYGQEIVSPAPQPIPKDFSLGKLDMLIDDKRVTSIECPGPGKLITVKSLGRVSATQIILSEDDIKKVIEAFSNAARIPVLGGIFKAAIGNLVITAVISDFVGSRFIINKYTPYSILEQVPQNLPAR